MTFRKTILSLAVLLLAIVPLALAQGTYTQIDVPCPSALGTYVYGVNTAGDLVGSYVTYDGSVTWDGFLFSGGVCTTIDYPGSMFTYLQGINDSGQIVGFAKDAVGSFLSGFVYDVSGQAFTTISHPHATFTFPYAINDAGTIAGVASHENSERSIGFELKGSTFHDLIPPNALQSYVLGIASSGNGVGFVQGTKSNFNFLYGGDGKYKHLPIPNAPGAIVNGVNPAGTVFVGYYFPSSSVTAGFVYHSDSFQELQFPGSSYTQAFGINSAGEVVGVFQDSNGDPHGFTWTPPAAAEKK